MKKNSLWKTVLLIAFVGVLAFGLVACNSSKNTEAMSKETIVVGFDNTFVPMGFKDEKGENVGFDIDLAKEFGKRINKKIKFQPIDWTMKETELNSGNIDMIWNGYSITTERKEKVSFSRPYLNNRQVIITMANSTIQSKATLKGVAVGAQSQSSAVDAINKEVDVLKGFKDGKIVTYETNNEALMDLEAGRIGAVVADEVMVRYYIAQKGAEKYKILSDDFGTESYGVGVRKTDQTLVSKLNEVFDAMKKDGTAKSISVKWFGEDLFQ